uniref:YqaJ viral recombinase domain-containing protein n=1 Tax=Amphimedon queenslandica TaxID=400682 RepID=A0A1X7VWY0_AMPQE
MVLRMSSMLHCEGHQDLVVNPSGVIVNPDYYCLGASPDRAVYDLSNEQEPFGFLEVKCPYSARNLAPTEACGLNGFCCHLNGNTLELNKSQCFYAQIQVQMAIGERPWCDFVIYPLKGIRIQRIPFDKT